MPDYRKEPADHYTTLHLLRENLVEANALAMFLSAIAQAIRELGDGDDLSGEQTRFLASIDENLERLHRAGRSGPESVQATEAFREVLDQKLCELAGYADPKN